MDIEKIKYVCYGCGIERPCRVETNQNQSSILNPQIEDLKYILDPTNQTSYKWEYPWGKAVIKHILKNLDKEEDL